MNAFHVRGVTNDFTTLSPTFTKMVPSRVQVSRICRSRFSVRASQAMVARDLVMSSLINRCVPFNFLAFRITAVLVLCVVKRTIISRGAERSSVFLPTRWERTKSLVPILTSSLWAANSLTSPSVSSFADSAKPRIRTVLRREYCSRSSQRSSRLTTLTCSSPIWASFLAIVSCSDLVRVTASPRSSWAKASVVTGASISIVVCGSSGVAGVSGFQSTRCRLAFAFLGVGKCILRRYFRVSRTTLFPAVLGQHYISSQTHIILISSSLDQVLQWRTGAPKTRPIAVTVTEITGKFNLLVKL